jgi:hypothetical protein
MPNHRSDYKSNGSPQPSLESQNNPYLLMDFWEFAIIATLMVAFFPWSLLFCVLFTGLTNTKLLVLALIYDGVQTAKAVLAVIVTLVAVIGGLFLLAASALN